MYERMLDKNIVSTAKEIKKYMGKKAVGNNVLANSTPTYNVL